MAIGATKPATPNAVAEAATGSSSAGRLESAPTVLPPEEESTEERLPPGTMVSNYRISRVLGEGGMGVVYAAEHVLMRKEVAVKVLHAEMCTEPEVVARFEREAIAAAHIDHPNVAGATDFGRLDDGSCFLVLELLRGTSLRDEIAKGPIRLSRALRILRGMASGVAAAHAKGIVHRDLKPENVMLVERDGSSDFVKVLDFGIAKVDPTVASAPQSIGKVLTRVGTVFGTPEYMAPEQAVGDTVDARADLYALGVIFLEMLTGKCPFTGNALSILRERILAVGPPDMSNVTDPGARALVARLLTREPDDRMQTGAELVAAVDSLLEEKGGASVPPPAISGPPPAISGPPQPPQPAVATTNPVVADAPAPAAPRSRPRLMILSIGVGAALAVMFGTFGLVKAIGGPHVEPAETMTQPSSTTPPPSVASLAAPSPTPRAAEPEPGRREAAPADMPTPTASAASARVAPRAKPSPKPARPSPSPRKK